MAPIRNDASQRTHRTQGIWVLRAEHPPLNLQGTFEQRLRPGFEAESFICFCHRVHHFGLQLWVILQAAVNFLFALVEDFSGCDGVAACLSWFRHLEHVRHELSNAVRAVTLPPDAPQLDRLSNRK